MTKQEFALKLLFFLFPWPVSKALPKATRIYYFGPSGAPPADWYHGWEPPAWWLNDPYNPGPENPGPVYPPRPPGRGWLTYFDNTRWTNSINTAWSVDKWVNTDKYEGTLRVLSNWASGFRPDLMEITYTGDLLTVRVWDENLNKLCEATSTESPATNTFDHKFDADVYYMEFVFDSVDFEILNIRFLET